MVCDFCDKKLNKGQSLISHYLKNCIFNNFDFSSFLVKYDDYKNFDLIDLKQGFKKKNENKEKWICIHCKKEFDFLSKFETHTNSCILKRNKIKEIIDGLDKELVKTINGFTKIYFDEINRLKLENQLNKRTLFSERETPFNKLIKTILSGELTKFPEPINKENLSFIDKSFFKKAISFPEKMTAFLCNRISFNVKNPERWNIFELNKDQIIYYGSDINENMGFHIQNKEDFYSFINSIRENQAFEFERRWTEDPELKEHLQKYNLRIEKITQYGYEKASLENMKKMIEDGTKELAIHINYNPDILQTCFGLD